MNKVISNIQEFVKQILGSSGKPSVREFTVFHITDFISNYSKWYDQHGLHLPPDYATNPAEWCEVMHKMKRAFELVNSEMEGYGELWEAKQSLKESVSEEKLQKIADLEKDIREGFALFGSQLYDMTDEWNGVAPGH